MEPQKETSGLNRLRELREEAVLTVRELSELSGVSEDTITKIENGHRKARPSTARKLAKAFGVEPREIISPSPEDAVVQLSPLQLKAVARPVEATTTVGVSVGLYWRVLEAAKGNRELNPDELRRAEEVLEEGLAE